MFKNLAVYRLKNGGNFSKENLEEALACKAFQECGSQDYKSVGWAPFGENGEYVLAASGHWLLRLQMQERLLPAAVVRQMAEKRAAEIEAKQGYKPGRKQMKDLKEQIVQELLPNALRKDSFVLVWIDPRGGWMGVDAGSLNKADIVAEKLRQTVDSLEFTLVRTERSPVSAMTDWLSGEAPEKFTVDRECELRMPTEERSVVKYVRHALDGGDVRDHLTQGKTPVSLAMTWDDQLSFVITEKFGIKKLAVLDSGKDSAEGQGEDALSMLIASVFIFGQTVSAMMTDLVSAMGGELRPATT